MGDTFTNARVWHSRLKGRSPLIVQFKGDPFTSKFSGRPIAYFVVRGDPRDDYYYEIEQDDILEQVKAAPKNTWLKLSAFGGEGSQTLAIEPASEGDLPPASTSTVVASGSAMDEQNFSSGYVVGDFVRCLDEAKGICQGWTEDPAVIQAMAATLYINWSHSRFLKPLSKDDVPEKTYVAEDHSDEYRTALEGLLGKLPKSSGTSHDGRKLKSTVSQITTTIEGDDPISDEQFSRVKKWLDDEIEHQGGPAEEEEYSDDLPF